MRYKKNSLKLFSLLLISSLISCSSNTQDIEGTIRFSTIESDSNSYKYHEVNYGDTLWSISNRYYRNPLLWPDIYKKNQDKIYDADLILPGQRLIIYKQISPNDYRKAIGHAKSRGLWVVGYREESDINFLENN